MITVVPPDTPVKIPFVEPIVAIEVFRLLQVPPPVALASVPVLPWQRVLGPVIAAGAAKTVTTLVAGVPHPFV